MILATIRLSNGRAVTVPADHLKERKARLEKRLKEIQARDYSKIPIEELRKTLPPIQTKEEYYKMVEKWKNSK